MQLKPTRTRAAGHSQRSRGGRYAVRGPRTVSHLSSLSSRISHCSSASATGLEPRGGCSQRTGLFGFHTKPISATSDPARRPSFTSRRGALAIPKPHFAVWIKREKCSNASATCSPLALCSRAYLGDLTCLLIAPWVTGFPPTAAVKLRNRAVASNACCALNDGRGSQILFISFAQ